MLFLSMLVHTFVILCVSCFCRATVVLYAGPMFGKKEQGQTCKKTQNQAKRSKMGREKLSRKANNLTGQTSGKAKT